MNEEFGIAMRKKANNIFTSPKNLQMDCFYLDLLGLERVDIKKLLDKSDLEGTDEISLDHIYTLIEAETIMYGLASMQTPTEIDPDEIEIPF